MAPFPTRGQPSLTSCVPGQSVAARVIRRSASEATVPRGLTQPRRSPGTAHPGAGYVQAMPRRRDATRLGGTRTPRTNPDIAARKELSARHPRLARLCELAHPIERTIPDRRPLSHLVVRTIVAQLVSTAAARSIMKMLLDAHGDMEGIVAWAMRTPADAPPSHSLSRAKRRAIAHWGFFLADHGDPRSKWQRLPADELIAEIVALRGLGPWSAQMIAIFGFGHPGIWPDGDAGVVRAAAVVFKGIRKPAMRKLILGHESHVALCCWALLDKGQLASFDLAGPNRPPRSGPRRPRLATSRDSR